MFGLSEAHYNLCKQAARRCGEDLQDQINAAGKNSRQRAKAYHELAKPCIDKHYKQVATLIPRLTFQWLIGSVNDRFGHDSGEYE